MHTLVVLVSLATVGCTPGGLEERPAAGEQPTSPSEDWPRRPWEMPGPDPAEWRLVVQVEAEGPTAMSLGLRVRNERDEEVELLFGDRAALFVVTDLDRAPVWWSLWDADIESIMRAHVFAPGEERAFTEDWSRIAAGGAPLEPGTYLAWGMLTRSLADESTTDGGGEAWLAAPDPVEFTLE